MGNERPEQATAKNEHGGHGGCTEKGTGKCKCKDEIQGSFAALRMTSFVRGGSSEKQRAVLGERFGLTWMGKLFGILRLRS
jgi:hypothetical protein